MESITPGLVSSTSKTKKGYRLTGSPSRDKDPYFASRRISEAILKKASFSADVVGA